MNRISPFEANYRTYSHRYFETAPSNYQLLDHYNEMPFY